MFGRMEVEIVISSQKPPNEDSSLQELVQKDATEFTDGLHSESLIFQKTYKT